MQIYAIDNLRFLCFVAIAFLHMFSTAEVNSLQVSTIIDASCRFAVPVFFLIAGFFIEFSNDNTAGKIVGYFKRIIIVFIVWQFVYYFIDFFIIDLDPSYQVKGLLVELVRIFYNGGLAFHLWFLPWLFACIVIFLLVKPFVPFRALPWLGLASLAIGLLIGPYNVQSGYYEILTHFSAHAEQFTARNTPFFGLAFLCFGHYLRRQPNLDRIPTLALVLIGIAGVGLELVETATITNLDAAQGVLKPWRFDVLIGTVLLSVSVFMLFAVKFPNGFGASSAAFCRNSLGFYCVHGIFVMLLNSYVLQDVPFAGLEAILIRTAAAFLVIALSTLVIMPVARVPALKMFVA